LVLFFKKAPLALIFLPSPNFNERPCGVDMIVLHYTGMQSAQAAIALLRSPDAEVSAHYVVDEDGEVVCLVEERHRAWHAGVSYWRGRTGLNDMSVGIEIVNPGHDWGYRAFPRVQMVAVRDLCLAVMGRHGACEVVAHSDIAPDRKRDPGELFDWKWLAGEGVGVWTDGGDWV
jgi:N-acetylmuramoyl-L-alanine amidase